MNMANKKQLGEDMLQWHSGGGSKVYAVGSHLIGGHEPPWGYTEEALKELENSLLKAPKYNTPDEILDLKSIIARLKSVSV